MFIRVEPQEREWLHQRALAAGLTFSEWCRQRLFQSGPPEVAPTQEQVGNGEQTVETVAQTVATVSEPTAGSDDHVSEEPRKASSKCRFGAYGGCKVLGKPLCLACIEGEME